MGRDLWGLLLVLAAIAIAVLWYNGTLENVINAAKGTTGSNNTNSNQNAPFSNPSTTYNGAQLTQPFTLPSLNGIPSISGGAFGYPISTNGGIQTAYPIIYSQPSLNGVVPTNGQVQLTNNNLANILTSLNLSNLLNLGGGATTNINPPQTGDTKATPNGIVYA